MSELEYIFIEELKKDLSKIDIEIYLLLKQNPNKAWKLAEIQKLVGRNKRAVRNSLKNLYSLELIKRIPNLKDLRTFLYGIGSEKSIV